MNKNIISLFIIGVFFCGITACNNAEVINATTDNDNTIENKAAIENNVVEPIKKSDPTKLEAASETEEADIISVNSVSTNNGGKVRKIDTKTFIDEIFDYKANPTKWVYKGDKPAIIDFYADWCGPCKKLSPIMDELAKKYDGQVNFYKINTDNEKELSGGVFGIKSIPSVLFIPLGTQPSMQPGLLSKAEYIKIIDEHLLKK